VPLKLKAGPRKIKAIHGEKPRPNNFARIGGKCLLGGEMGVSMCLKARA